MSLRITVVLLGALMVLSAPPLVSQNLILNGDFEDTVFTGCNFNLSNLAFTDGMQDCAGFSTTLFGIGEICVMEGGDCGWGLPAPSGTVKLGLAATGPPTFEMIDQFSMTLSASVVEGQQYELSFQAMAIITGFSPDISEVDIGISSSPTDFGTLIFTGTPGVGWTTLSHEFISPVSGAYLTARQQAGSDSWNHVDDFQLEEVVSECFLVVGDGVTGDTFFPGSHAWTTQVGQVMDHHAVLLEDLSEFVLPGPGPFVGAAGAATPAPGKTSTTPNDWMASGSFSVQVVMWNPQVFPGLPEQWTHGLHVRVLPDGSVLARPYGSGTGMTIGYELDEDDDGNQIIRFPFTIPGL